MARKKKYVPKAFESGKAGDVSANIYASMIQSRAWSNLTNNARVLYVYMKLQYYGQKTIPDREQECFYFNKAMFIKTYQLYKNVNQFYKDKKLLHLKINFYKGNKQLIEEILRFREKKMF